MAHLNWNSNKEVLISTFDSNGSCSARSNAVPFVDNIIKINYTSI